MKWLYKPLGFLAVGLSWIGSTWLAFMVVDRGVPLTYEGARALQSTVTRGGSIDVEFDVYRTRICPSVIRRYLVDGKGAQHAVTAYTVGSNAIKGREIYQRTITIPVNAAAGRATYFVRLEYTCNLLQQLGWPVMVESPPVTFQIEEPPFLLPLLTPFLLDGK